MHSLLRMGRRLLERSSIFPYHVYARSNNREWFSAPLPKIYGMFANQFETVVGRYNFQIHAFVLMSNHFHLILSTPLANLDKGMQYLMTQSSKGIARMSNRINKIYGARYRWTIIKDPKHYAYAVKYVYRNPVQANILERAEDYPWTTLNKRHRKFSRILVPNANGFEEFIPQDRKELLSWVNNEFEREQEAAIQKALRKTEFKFPRNASGYVTKLP